MVFILSLEVELSFHALVEVQIEVKVYLFVPVLAIE